MHLQSDLLIPGWQIIQPRNGPLEDKINPAYDEWSPQKEAQQQGLHLNLHEGRDIVWELRARLYLRPVFFHRISSWALRETTAFKEYVRGVRWRRTVYARCGRIPVQRCHHAGYLIGHFQFTERIRNIIGRVPIGLWWIGEDKLPAVTSEQRLAPQQWGLPAFL